jgi:hypothetical protein
MRLGRHVEIQIAIRAQARLGIETSDGPALPDEHRYARGPQQGRHLAELVSVDGALQDMGPKGLAQHVEHRRRLEPRGRAQPAPSEPGVAAGQQERSDFAQLSGRESENRRLFAPRPREDGGDEPPALEETRPLGR